MIAEISWFTLIIEKIIGPLLTVVGLALAGMLGVALTKLRRKFNLEIDQQQLDQVERAIEEAILRTNQKFVDDLRKKTADGKLSKDEALGALRTTKEYAVERLNELAKDANKQAKKLLEDGGLLEEKIESIIPLVKAKIEKLK